MATEYTHTDYYSPGPFPDLGSAWFYRHVDETTIGAADEDTYRLFTLKRGMRICDALLQNEQGDTHATPTGEVDLEITDGTTTKTIIDAVAMETAGLSRPSKANATEDAIGFIVPNDDWWCQLRANTVAATSTAHDYHVLVQVSPHRKGGELTE